MFSQGTLPTKEETYGWWTGRCYDFQLPNSPQGQILVSRSIVIKDPADHGPGFPSKPDEIKHQMVIYVAVDRSNNFDRRNLSKFKKDLKGYLEKGSERRLIAVEENGSLSYQRVSRNAKHSIRKYQNYFIGQLALLRDEKIGGIDYRAGKIYGNCYFFKQVYSY